MYPDPLWSYVSYLAGRARLRTSAARGSGGDLGALTLEWIVIASVIVAAAVLAGVWFATKVSDWESQVKG